MGELSLEGLSDALSATDRLCLAMAERSLLDIMDCHWKCHGNDSNGVYLCLDTVEKTTDEYSS